METTCATGHGVTIQARHMGDTFPQLALRLPRRTQQPGRQVTLAGGPISAVQRREELSRSACVRQRAFQATLYGCG